MSDAEVVVTPSGSPKGLNSIERWILVSVGVLVFFGAMAIGGFQIYQIRDDFRIAERQIEEVESTVFGIERLINNLEARLDSSLSGETGLMKEIVEAIIRLDQVDERSNRNLDRIEGFVNDFAIEFGFGQTLILNRWP